MLKMHPSWYNRLHMTEQDRSLTPVQRLYIQREDAVSKLEAGDGEVFNAYLADLTLELNKEMRLVSGPEGGNVEAAWLVSYSTSTLAALYLADTRTALERGVTPIWLDLAAVNFMIMDDYRGFQVLFDGYLELKKEANEKGIRGIDTMKFLPIAK